VKIGSVVISSASEKSFHCMNF